MITSTRNPRVASAARLKRRDGRERERRFLIEGARLIEEAVRSKARIAEVFVAGDPGRAHLRAAERAGAEVVEVSDAVLRHLAATESPQGAVAVAAFVDVTLDAIHGDGPVAVLAEVRDPGNAGAVLRSADAAGAAAVVFTRSSVDAYNAKAVRASAGSLFHLPVVRDVDAAAVIRALRGRGFRVLAATAGGEDSVYERDLTGEVAFVFGSEAHGLAPELAAQVDGTVRVPMRARTESLNLAAAAAVVLFESARQRTLGPSGRRLAGSE
ncbi:MAG TPA: RNA methyltransferase [Actinomycetota bacterium]